MRLYDRGICCCSEPDVKTHLSDDKAVAKMGHPDFRCGSPVLIVLWRGGSCWRREECNSVVAPFGLHSGLQQNGTHSSRQEPRDEWGTRPPQYSDSLSVDEYRRNWGGAYGVVWHSADLRI